MKYDVKGLVLLGALIGTAACSSDRLAIPNYNKPVITDVTKDPQAIQLLATGIIQRERSLQPGTSQDFGFFGRESYIYFPTDGRNVTGFLVGVPGFGGKTIDPGGFAATATNWGSRFANMRNVKNFLSAIDKSPTLSDAEKKAAHGFANTFVGLDMMYVLYSRDTLGAVTETNDDPKVLAPLVSKDSAYKFATGMLEQAKADLVAAGDASFPFTLSRGFAGFDTPATFIKFNRAILARVLVNRASQGCGNSCYTDALAAIDESFATPIGGAASLADLNVGVYNNYSTATGDVQNTLSFANNKSLFAHASNVTDAQKQANGTTPDDRLTRKVVSLESLGLPPVSPPQGIGIPAEYTFQIYPQNNSDVPIIRNEELILLRAEANIFLGNLPAALLDINNIRAVSGKLPPTTLTAADALTKLLYERRYSLLLEGQRWNDYRRFGILNQLPLDNTSGTYTHFVARVQPVPLAECDARPAPKPQGCP
jgi:starch-binding outer membrane protein, SusD/RagB family